MQLILYTYYLKNLYNWSIFCFIILLLRVNNLHEGVHLWAGLLQLISLRLAIIMTGSTNRKNWLSFGGDLVQIAILDHFFTFITTAGCRIFWDDYLATFLIQSQHSANWLTSINNVTNLHHFTSDPADELVYIRINPEIWIWIPITIGWGETPW